MTCPGWRARYSQMAREVAEGLARDGVCGQQDVPTAYRYLILNKDGYVLMTDLERTRRRSSAR